MFTEHSLLMKTEQYNNIESYNTKNLRASETRIYFSKEKMDHTTKQGCHYNFKLPGK